MGSGPVAWLIALSVVSLAFSCLALFRSLPARIYQRLSECEEIARTSVSHINAFKAEHIAREAAQAKFLEEAEDLLETAGRKQRRAAASLSKIEAKERRGAPGFDPDAPDGAPGAAPAAPLSEDDQKALLAAKHLQ